MNIQTAVHRIREALKRRCGRQLFSVTRDYDVKNPSIYIHVPPRERVEDKMSIDNRRLLADLLGLRTRDVPATGIVVEPDEIETYVAKAEAGLLPA